MIAAKELRSGNLVKDSAGNFIPVTSIHSEGINLNYQEIETEDGDIMVLEPDYRLDQIDPIPLTGEILRKLNFDTMDAEVDYVEWGMDNSDEPYFFLIQNSLDELNEPFYFKYDLGMGEKSIEIKYLHQLQNLHLVLTGEELEFKEPVNQ